MKLTWPIIFRPWRWPAALARKLAAPLSPGLWITNVFFQRILRVNADIPWMVHFTSKATGRLTLGTDVWISLAASGGCYLQGENGIIVGDHTIFAPGVKIISANHDATDYHRWTEAEPVRIGCRCWLGANAVILPGVQLGDGCIVGAGAVVTKSFAPGSIVAGVPAILVRQVAFAPSGC